MAIISSFSKSMSLFLFCKQVNLHHFFLDSIYKGSNTIFLLLCLNFIIYLVSPSLNLYGLFSMKSYLYSIFPFSQSYIINYLFHMTSCTLFTDCFIHIFLGAVLSTRDTGVNKIDWTLAVMELIL